jgi:amino acid adenylation domain-containing protein
MASPDVKRVLLEKCLRGELGLETRQKIAPRKPDEPVPLSYSQEQVWMHAQLVPDVPLYNEPVTIHYTGALDPAAFERAFNEILRRHEAWRTCFQIVDGEPVQVVMPELSISLPVIDLRMVSEERREMAAIFIATEVARKPLDLARPPLFRARLMRLGDENYRLYLTLSHIIFDGVAIYRVFLPELATLYKAYAAGAPSPLPELAVQYPDYSIWQRRTLTREVLSKDVEYWREKLRGPLPETYLPTDHPLGRSQSFRGSMYPFRLSSSLTSRLRKFCRAEGVSLFHVLLASFSALLYRYSGEERIPIGSVTAGRNFPETLPLLGYFLNTVVLPVDLSGNPSFRTLVHHSRALTIDVLDHDRVSFEHLVRELRVPRDPGRNPLFQALFSLEPPLPEVDPAWRLTQMDIDTGASKYDLYLELDERPDEVLARFHHSTDLFDAKTIVRMAANWKLLLDGAVANPDQRLSELPVLTSEEREQILERWNNTGSAFPEACVHELFELQVERSPDAIALTSQDFRLTYRELNQRANQLAGYLRKRGVGPDVCVGLCVDRGPAMVIALLGILKAGGAYVPLDPRLPDERLSYMLADVQPLLVLTKRSLRREIFGKDAVILDAGWDATTQKEVANSGNHCHPQNLAYVIYTSGSTGKPKGVPIEHRSIVNLLCSMQRTLGVSPEDPLLAVTTLSFDIAGLEIYLPLISGACVTVASEEDVVDGYRLRDLIAESGATVMQATPATWRLLLEAGWQGSSNLKILCGGETLAPELAKDLIARGNSVWNVYGPTETTIWSTVYRVTGQEQGPIPIGRPIANTCIYILDSYRNPVPANVIGEIYIGGAGLARGYLNRVELTAERFVANWLERDRSERLYRTGDWGRFRSNGEIEYLGRVDGEVKLRGMRIDLGEIESVLVGHAGVREAAVERVEEGGEAKLVAYLVRGDGEELNGWELRRHLRTKLPEHMVPARFVEVEEFPLLPSGKVNRKALRAAAGTPLLEQGMAAPRTETERGLAEIWKELLKVEEVGVEQNFFELGGHSLLVLQVMARIRRRFGLEVPVRTVFEEPTIAGLAAAVEAAEAQGLKAQTPILERRPRPAAVVAATREALLAQLDKLSADDLQTLLKRAMDGTLSQALDRGPQLQ